MKRSDSTAMTRPSSRSIPGLGALAACLLATLGRTAAASPVSGSLGFEYFADSQHVVSRAATAVLGVGLAGGQVLAGALRYDHSTVGLGSGALLGADLPAGPDRWLRVLGTRYIGDGDYRGWRVKAGPRFVAASSEVALYYVGEDNTASGRTNGALLEAESRWLPMLTGRVSAGYAAGGAGTGTAYGGAGMAFRVARSLEVGADLSVSHRPWNPVGVANPSSRGGAGLPLIGGGNGGPEETSPEEPTVSALVSIRVPFP